MLWIAALSAALGLCWVLFALAALWRTHQETRGARYFGLTLAERRAAKQRIAARARFVRPVVRGLVWLRAPRSLHSCEYRGVRGPGITCSPRSFESTFRMRPDGRDIFVATQMKCGTTWMQQIVYEILMRGRGDLGDAGHRHLYATSPWVESTASVALDDAPRIGPRQQRLIKTHMPADLVPFAAAARYVYVTRHPVACFASTRDFVRMLAGPMAPSGARLLDWFCSERMFWRPWPDHVAGWWDQAAERRNVLFVHYEDMLADLPGAVARVAAFLDVALAPAERDAVVAKSTFEYMKAHEEEFEMAPPSLLGGDGAFLASGSRAREHGVDGAARRRILAYCRERLEGRAYPVERFYPDVVGA